MKWFKSCIMFEMATSTVVAIWLRISGSLLTKGLTERKALKMASYVLKYSTYDCVLLYDLLS